MLSEPVFGISFQSLLKVRQFRNNFWYPRILPKNEWTNSFFLPNSEFVRSFFGKIQAGIPKSPFEIIWPLERPGQHHFTLQSILVLNRTLVYVAYFKFKHQIEGMSVQKMRRTIDMKYVRLNLNWFNFRQAVPWTHMDQLQGHKVITESAFCPKTLSIKRSTSSFGFGTFWFCWLGSYN